MESEQGVYDLAVIGGGPGGYVAALRGARCGLRTALIEREEVGGVCLNWGCIPTKALLRSALLWREVGQAARWGLRVAQADCDYAAIQGRSRQTVARLVKGVHHLLRGAQVEVIAGTGTLAGREGERVRVRVQPAGTLTARRVILASGARPIVPRGMVLDEERVLSSRGALQLTAVPRRLLIVGAGAIGLEFADLFSAFGAEVTLVEMQPRILPAADAETTETLRVALVRRGVRIHTGTVVAGVETQAGEQGTVVKCTLRAAARESTPAELIVDRVLVGIGMTGNHEALGLESVGLEARGGFVPVDGHQRTGAAGVYAIGDLTGPPLLAHWASAAGVHAAEHAAGRELPEMDRAWVPMVVFTHPQMAFVGTDEATARAAGKTIAVGKFPLLASGKALADGEINGFVKVVVEMPAGRLLGAQLVGGAAAELIAEATLIGACGIEVPRVLRAVHAHPTWSETLAEALAAALGEAVHLDHGGQRP